MARSNDRPVALRNDAECSARQPVPFSHEHHVGGLGIDCRYCHTTVENLIREYSRDQDLHELSFADVGRGSDLEPVRESYRTGKSIEWTRVNDLPEFVYFNHSIHVNQGSRL